MKKSKEENIITTGAEFGHGLRETSRYEQTQDALVAFGLIDSVLNKTPPVGLNLRILSERMPIARKTLGEQLPEHPHCALLGLAILDGIQDLDKLLQQVGHSWSQLTVVDIDSAIIQQIEENNEHDVVALLSDARKTGLSAGSQQLVVRDHLGNCCPPNMYAEIEKEVARILEINGFSLVNISTSENLANSLGREKINQAQLETMISSIAVFALQSHVFDLSQLKREFPEIDVEALRGKLLEIAPDSHVIFGEDRDGHGEWFSSFAQQEALWQQHGFEIIDHSQRVGHDSHQPPLECVRHVVLLKKTNLEET